MSDENPVKRWTAKRKAAVLMDINKGKTTAAKVARQYDLTVSEIDGWIDEVQRSMERVIVKSGGWRSGRIPV